MKFDERNKKKLNPPFFYFMATVETIGIIGQILPQLPWKPKRGDLKDF
jgi:hypothetical protein